jgi:hypothetical protein
VFERLLNEPPYSLRQSEKEAMLLEGLNELTRFHYERSPEYARILDAAWGGLKTYRDVAEVPYLPVSLFKEMEGRTAPEFTRMACARAERPRRRAVHELPHGHGAEAFRRVRRTQRGC